MRVPWVLVEQWFRYRIFDILNDRDVNPVLVLLAFARAAEAEWDTRPDLDWFQYTFGERMVSILPA